MKTLRMIGMALFAMMLCMNLSSCSSSGDDELIDGVNWSDQSDDDDDDSQSSGSASYDDDDEDSQSSGSANDDDDDSQSSGSANDDDDDIWGSYTNGGTIEINGEDYEIDPYITLEGHWDVDDDNVGTFTVSVFHQVGSSKDCLYYQFFYVDTRLPEVGDDFATKSLTLEPLDGTDATFRTLSYSSGSAVIKDLDKTYGTLTIDFDNLTMSGSGFKYVFDGTADVDFNFGR